MSQLFPLPNVTWPRETPAIHPTPGVMSADKWEARIAVEAPRMPWDVFRREVFAWDQGQHVAVIGPTGQGKTTLMMHLIPMQSYVVVFATKPRDSTMDALISHGYTRMDRWEAIPADRAPRRVLWPSARELGSEATQRKVFVTAMEKIYREMGWTVVIDEGSYLTNTLKMQSEIVTFLQQGRSLGISLVFATQRPAYVPLDIYDQSTHLFLYRDNDERNLARLSGVSWRSASLIRHVVANLEQYQVLYINTRSGQMARTRVPAPIMRREETS
jgi:hypothetical protein